jgi:hypothetical protein
VRPLQNTHNQAKTTAAPTIIVMSHIIFYSQADYDLASKTNLYLPPPGHYTLIEEKYLLTLRAIDEMIADQTHKFISKYASHEYFCNNTIVIIPSPDKIRSGLSVIEACITCDKTEKVGADIFHASYRHAFIGKNFDTDYFMQLKPLPGQLTSSFAITLPDTYRQDLVDGNPNDHVLSQQFEKQWKSKNLTDKIRVQFTDHHGQLNYTSTSHFAIWFASQLAKKYLYFYYPYLSKEEEHACNDELQFLFPTTTAHTTTTTTAPIASRLRSAIKKRDLSILTSSSTTTTSNNHNKKQRTNHS